MTRQKLPIDEQLQNLAADDFKNLPVAKALLAKHTQDPLFKQVANFLDGSASNNTVTVKPHKPETKAEAKAALEKVSTLLQGNLKRLETNLKSEELLHKRSLATLDRAMKKQQTRKYEKWHALAVRDVASLKDSIKGIE